MYRINDCVSSQLIQHMCKSVQSSFDNSSMNVIYSCKKAKMIGKRYPFSDQIRSYIKSYSLQRRLLCHFKQHASKFMLIFIKSLEKYLKVK
jgi:hypothetical protein